MPNNKDSGFVARLLEHDLKVIQASRIETLKKLDRVQPTPVEAQVAFIKELMKSETEMDAFLKNPKQYAVDHGVMLTPEVVKTVHNAVLFDVALEKDVVDKLGPHAIEDIIDMRAGKPTGSKANLMAVAAAAAVVAAVAAVVTMVVTLVRATQPADLVSLQGLGKQGIKLPNDKSFIQRDLVQPQLRLDRNVLLNNPRTKFNR